MVGLIGAAPDKVQGQGPFLKCWVKMLQKDSLWIWKDYHRESIFFFRFWVIASVMCATVTVYHRPQWHNLKAHLGKRGRKPVDFASEIRRAVIWQAAVGGSHRVTPNKDVGTDKEKEIIPVSKEGFFTRKGSIHRWGWQTFQWHSQGEWHGSAQNRSQFLHFLRKNSHFQVLLSYSYCYLREGKHQFQQPQFSHLWEGSNAFETEEYNYTCKLQNKPEDYLDFFNIKFKVCEVLGEKQWSSGT